LLWLVTTSDRTHAFLYTSGSGMVDLNTLIAPLSGWELLDASDINDAGQITGQGRIGGQFHAYLLTPVPIPGDFNHNGTLDAADYVVWRKINGTQSGYDTWRANFGQTAGNGSGARANAAVPEPTTLIILVAVLIGRGIANARQYHKLMRRLDVPELDRFRRGLQCVSKLIDTVAFRYSHGAPETHLRGRPDTPRPF
jgi:hypothetical protein